MKPSRGGWLPDNSSSKSWTQARGPRLVSTSDLRMKSTETELSRAWAKVSSVCEMPDSLGKRHYIFTLLSDS